MSTTPCVFRLPLVTPVKHLTLAISAVLLVSGCSNSRPINGPIVTNKAPMVSKRVVNTKMAKKPAPAPKKVIKQAAKVPANQGYSTAFLDEESLDELANLLEATDMTIVEDNKLAIQKYGDLWNRLRAGYRMNHGQYGYNARIEAQKSWFSSRQDYLNRLTARASRYLYHTVREAERRNIPTELALLPVIESSYDPSATSNASAAGLWQFIPSTGRIYGLNQSGTYDGRRDVIESTRAAYDFLTALHNQFGSWELALAAYNAGPGRIQKAIDKNAARGLPTDFWSLQLPSETMNYVPRFLAVADIVSKPSQYGVYLPAIANRQHFRSVPVNYGVSLAKVAQVTGVSYDELQKLNPALIAKRVDPSGPQRVVIPNDVNINLDTKISALTGYGSSGTSTISAGNTQAAYNKPYEYSALPSDPAALAEYAARAGVPKQTTSYIPPARTPISSSVYSSQATVVKEPPISSSEAKKINAELINSNSLPTTSAQVTQNNTIVQEPPLSKAERDFIAKQIQRQSPNVSEVVSPVDGNIKLAAVQTQQSILEAKGEEKKLSYAAPGNTAATSKPRPKGKRSTYTVKRGDTLSNIASRAGVSWRQIADWNQIDPRANLLAGSTLYLYNAKPIAPLSASSQGSTSNTPTRPDSYIVRAGDTLIGTAHRFGMSVSQLASYNNLNSSAELLRGQRLWLVPGRVSRPQRQSVKQKPQPTIPTTRYTVKSGDGLIALAREFGVSVSTLAELNGLSPTEDLYVGQQLRVPAGAQRSRSSDSSRRSERRSSYSGNTTTYRVRSGDGLIALANRLGVSVSTLADLNGLKVTDNLLVGQRLKVPATTDNSGSNRQSSPAQSSSRGVQATYKVKSGDTLIGLANKLGVSAQQIAAMNRFDANAQLRRGQTINLPVSADNLKRAGTGAATKYKIQSGDTLIGVAARHGVSVSHLAAANDLSTQANLIRGRTLTIPAKGAGSTAASGSKSRSSSQDQGKSLKDTERYKVRSGDSLIGLARKFNVSVRDLAATNNIASNAQLQRGQYLQVPKMTTTYTVQSGDTLIGLARQYNLSTQRLAQMNDIPATTELQRGQKLTVPNR